MPELRSDFEALVRIPSVAFEGFDQNKVDEAGDEVEKLFARLGLSIQRPAIRDAKPAVFGARQAASGMPTVLLYAHYDVQPPGEDTAWSSPPFEPTERGGRLYGRGTADNKSGVIMHLGAIKALGDCGVGIKVLIEGQEENGMGGIEEFVLANGEMLKSDVIVVGDVGNYALGVPTLTTSLRGMAALDVEVETLQGEVHSGMFGGVAPDAYIALTRMLASLHDEAGDVAVAGLSRYDYQGADYDESAYRTDAGVLDGVGLIGTGTVAERLYGRASITVIGVDVPPVEGSANALIPRTRARVSIRLAPGQDPAEAQKAVKAHLESAAPWDVKVTVTLGILGEGFLAKTDGPGYASAETAMKGAYGKDTVFYGQGGSIPLVSAFLEAVPGAELIMWGTEEPQCKIHAPNESVDLAELERCIVAEALFIAGMAEKG
jgi:acetylornithine deacetylase/succinyl-diaminopimelate desuccinylase-like protein